MRLLGVACFLASILVIIASKLYPVMLLIGVLMSILGIAILVEYAHDDEGMK